MICSVSKDVRISQTGVCKLAEKVLAAFRSGEYSRKSWKEHELNPKIPDRAAVDWIFFIDTLNFSFWPDGDDKYIVNYGDKSHTGYWSICAAVQRALQAGIPITTAEYYSKVSAEELRSVLKSDSSSDIPLFEERLKILHESGNTLLKEFDGSFTKCLERCDHSAQKLLQLIVQHFPSYKDEAVYGDIKVGFYKRAQILIADIWACFEGEGLGSFEDIDSITMFADYRVPQALAYFGVLEYSEDLTRRMKANEVLENGSRLEVEIRAASIWAVELINEAAQNLAQTDGDQGKLIINSIMLDNYLWDYRRDHSEAIESTVPYHRTRCIYY
jgi:hypothetical protein